MAASDARPVPRKNVAYRFYFAIRNPSDATLITSWTGADSEVSKDGAAFSDCTNEATEIGTSGCGYIDLTSTEMNADSVVLKITVSNTGAVPLVFTLYPEEIGDYRIDVDIVWTVTTRTLSGTVNDFDELVTALNTAHGSGSWATATGFSTHSAADVWGVATRILTAGTNIVLAKGSGITGFTDLNSTQVENAVWDALKSNHTTADTFGDYLDDEISSRMASYTQPSGFLATTFPSGTVASTTNITAGTITTVTTTTTLTNLPAITTNWLTAAGVSAAAANKIADHNRRRTQANVEASSDGDSLNVSSMYGAIQMMQDSNTVDNVGFLTIYRTDGTTELAQKVLTTDADAEPVTGIE